MNPATRKSREPSTARLLPGQAVAIAAGVTLAVCSFFYWVKFQGNITGFFRIGDVLPLSPYLDPSQALINPGELGYDGQQFLSLAFDPGLGDPGTWAALDNPTYRYRRIFYPLLGYGLALGQRSLIPYAMVAINVCCVPLLVGAVSWELNQNRQVDSSLPLSPPWLPLLVLCIPGIWITLAFSTADLLSSTLMVMAIVAYRARRLPQQELWAALAISLACLTRETMLLAWGALLLSSFWERHWKQVGALMVAVVPLLAWSRYVTHLSPAIDGLGGGGIFSLPFSGVIRKFAMLFTGGLAPKNLFEAYSFLLLLVVFGLVVVLARYIPSRNRVIWLCGCFYGFLLSISNDAILWYFAGYLRVYSDSFLLLMLVSGVRNHTWKMLPFGVAIVPTLAFIFLSS